MQLALDLQTFSFNPSWTYMSRAWSTYETEIRRKYGIKNAIWSMDCVDLEAEGFTSLTAIWDTDEDLNRHEVALEGSRAIDVLSAFAKLMELTGDYHHCFLEVLEEDGRVWAGS